MDITGCACNFVSLFGKTKSLAMVLQEASPVVDDSSPERLSMLIHVRVLCLFFLASFFAAFSARGMVFEADFLWRAALQVCTR